MQIIICKLMRPLRFYSATLYKNLLNRYLALLVTVRCHIAHSLDVLQKQQESAVHGELYYRVQWQRIVFSSSYSFNNSLITAEGYTRQ